MTTTPPPIPARSAIIQPPAPFGLVAIALSPQDWGRLAAAAVIMQATLELSDKVQAADEVAALRRIDAILREANAL